MKLQQLTKRSFEKNKKPAVFWVKFLKKTTGFDTLLLKRAILQQPKKTILIGG